MRRCASLSLLAILLHLNGPSCLWAGQMAILKVVLNQEEKGEFLVSVEENGDFLLSLEDLKKMGFSDPRGKTTVMEGSVFLSLKSLEGVTIRFDEKKLILHLSADPRLLTRKTLPMRYAKQLKVYYPKETSAFLNYHLTAFAGDGFVYEKTALTNQLGFRTGDILFLSDSSYADQKGERGRFVRLQSNMTYDQRETLRRFVLGDAFASSGDLGSTLNLGGMSFSKVYRIDPYFISYPEVSFSGLASLPSDVEVYRDGVLIKKDRISPGGFELRDIPTYVGTGMVEVVLRDPFGKEQRIRLPYYFSDRLLKQGLHDFSYHLGFLREAFGDASNRYGDLAFLGFHRYGFSPTLTAGMRAEASKDVLNLGPSLTWLLPGRSGLVDASLAWSRVKGGESGGALSLGYLYQGRDLSVNGLLRSFSRDYSNLVLERAKKESEKLKWEVSGGASYSSSLLGSFSIGWSQGKKDSGAETRNLLASYSRRITERSTLVATFKRDFVARSSEVMLRLNYFFKKGITASGGYQRSHGISSEQLQVMKNLPLGEGFGGRILAERAEGQEGTIGAYDLQLQYNGRYGQLAGECSRADRTDAYSFSVAGAVAYVGRTLGLTRPIQDSFALVKVGDLKDVQVFFNNQEMGRTDASGKILIPNLGSYQDNQITVNDRDIPMEYTLSEVARYVSPPLRSGSFVEFGATKIQAVIGTLKVKIGEALKTAEYVEFKLMVEGKERLFPTGKDGEFYLENLKPGTYRGQVHFLDKDRFFEVTVPKSDEILVDIGEVICE